MLLYSIGNILNLYLSETITIYSSRYPIKLEEGLYRLQITEMSYRMSATLMCNKLPLVRRSAPSI